MYDITSYTRRNARRLGVHVQPSSIPTKKIDVFQGHTKIASVGAIGYSDYPHYLLEKGKAYADERRRLYHLRHQKQTIGERMARQLLW